jgi:hypothetical protein
VDDVVRPWGVANACLGCEKTPYGVQACLKVRKRTYYDGCNHIPDGANNIHSDVKFEIHADVNACQIALQKYLFC